MRLDALASSLFHTLMSNLTVLGTNLSTGTPRLRPPAPLNDSAYLRSSTCDASPVRPCTPCECSMSASTPLSPKIVILAPRRKTIGIVQQRSSTCADMPLPCRVRYASRMTHTIEQHVSWRHLPRSSGVRLQRCWPLDPAVTVLSMRCCS